jgi:hypothetical protein
MLVYSIELQYWWQDQEQIERIELFDDQSSEIYVEKRKPSSHKLLQSVNRMEEPLVQNGRHGEGNCPKILFRETIFLLF